VSDLRMYAMQEVRERGKERGVFGVQQTFGRLHVSAEEVIPADERSASDIIH
jgi:hypothetical protein